MHINVLLWGGKHLINIHHNSLFLQKKIQVIIKK